MIYTAPLMQEIEMAANTVFCDSPIVGKSYAQAYDYDDYYFELD